MEQEKADKELRRLWTKQNGRRKVPPPRMVVVDRAGGRMMHPDDRFDRKRGN